jgi:hypothetical protein
MTCGMRCYLPPIPASSIGRLVLLLAAVLCLMLSLQTNAAAKPALVAITTRVVGTGQNPYSTQICTQNCNTTPVLTTYTATGGARLSRRRIKPRHACPCV